MDNIIDAKINIHKKKERPIIIKNATHMISGDPSSIYSIHIFHQNVKYFEEVLFLIM